MIRHLTPPAQRLRQDQGFTLIELLVVILIVGILAAVAIPTFLTQTAKASDAEVQAAINTAQIAEKSYLTDNERYTDARGTSGNPLVAIESTLSTAFAATSGSPEGYGMTVTGASQTDFTISATDPRDSIVYTLTESGGSVSRSCALTGGGSAANQGACDAGGHWGS
jgi:type IV pilus assembly protein PilA